MLKVGSIWCGWVQHVTSTGLVLLPHHVNIPKNKSETLHRANSSDGDGLIRVSYLVMNL
jgi:hypothetical protein